MYIISICKFMYIHINIYHIHENIYIRIKKKHMYIPEAKKHIYIPTSYIKNMYIINIYTWIITYTNIKITTYIHTRGQSKAQP
jgi:hypothetical protein